MLNHMINAFEVGSIAFTADEDFRFPNCVDYGPNFLQNESSQSSQIKPLTRET